MNYASADLPFTVEDFTFIAQKLYRDTGITLQRSKMSLVYLRLAKRLRALGLSNFKAYCSLISTAGNEEVSQMHAELSTNVTSFFREQHHFEHLQTVVLPILIAKARAGKRIRLWSAGCSSGEEAYSIALSILALVPEARSLDIKVLATDINPQMLEVARLGRYTEQEVRSIEHSLRVRWTDPITVDGVKFCQLDDAARGLVTFRVLNLMEQWPMQCQFQVIYCRNVVIYFDELTQNLLWRRLAPHLERQGVLYIGHSERVAGETNLDLQYESRTTYRKIA